MKSPDNPNGQEAAAALQVSVVRINDPTAVGDDVELLDQDIVNLDTSDFEAKRVTVPFPQSGLMYQRTNAHLRTRTRVHELYDACTVLGPDAYGSLDGIELSPFSMIFASPGASAEIIVGAGYESVTLLVKPRVLDKHLALRIGTRDFVMPESVEVLHPDEDVAMELFELGKRISQTAEDAPDIFNENHWARFGAQVEYIDSLLTTIESCITHESEDIDKTAVSYSQIVKACEDYTLNLEDRRPYISELCEVASVSERTLQYAFHNILGMSPLTYLHRLRLHRARDELRNAEHRSTTVTNVAMNWGFWHFGEFSRSYKNCFGEVPSATLKQAPGK